MAALPGLGADAVVEFYRTHPDAEQYVLHETSLYELRRTSGDYFGRKRDFWRRAAEKFAENPEVVRLCGERERHVEMCQGRDDKRLEENVGSRLEDGERVFMYEWCAEEKDGEFGILVLAPDGSVKWRKIQGSPGNADARWRQENETIRRTIGERAAELEADAAARFLDKRPDAANHSLHATSVPGLELYLVLMLNATGSKRWIEQHCADVPGLLEFAEAEETALRAWRTPRNAIVEKLRAEAEATDRLYWDEFDDGEHRRAGLLWLRWDGSVRQEWPCFGEDGDPAGAGTKQEVKK